MGSDFFRYGVRIRVWYEVRFWVRNRVRGRGPRSGPSFIVCPFYLEARQLLEEITTLFGSSTAFRRNLGSFWKKPQHFLEAQQLLEEILTAFGNMTAFGRNLDSFWKKHFWPFSASIIIRLTLWTNNSFSLVTMVTRYSKPGQKNLELKYVITKTCKCIIRIIDIIYAWIASLHRESLNRTS